MKKIILTLLILYNIPVFSQEIPFTQDDRDRLIRLEVKLDESVKSLQKQIDEIRTFLYWGFGILFAGMVSMVGFVLWDRRTVVSPIKRELDELKEENERIKKLIKEYATGNEEFLKIAKKLGLF